MNDLFAPKEYGVIFDEVEPSYYTVNSCAELRQKGWHRVRAKDLSRRTYFVLTVPKKYPARLYGWAPQEIRRVRGRVIFCYSEWKYNV